MTRCAGLSRMLPFWVVGTDAAVGDTHFPAVVVFAAPAVTARNCHCLCTLYSERWLLSGCRYFGRFTAAQECSGLIGPQSRVPFSASSDSLCPLVGVVFFLRCAMLGSNDPAPGLSARVSCLGLRPWQRNCLFYMVQRDTPQPSWLAQR